MPELPEVETICRDLRKLVVGLKVVEVDLRRTDMIRGLSGPDFRRRLAGFTIEKVGRRAKMILIESRDQVLLIHLKMSGRLTYCDADKAEEKHTHIIFHLSDGRQLRFADTRRFGFLRLFSKNRVAEVPELSKLGPEPLEITPPEFRELFKNKATSRRPLKTLLMDQTFIVGIGNIYADEILFAAKILPERMIGSLSDNDISRIYQEMRRILNEAIKNRGTTVATYADASGAKGGHQEKLMVYGRGGEPCFICGAPVERIKLGGRGTHFCAQCQC